MSDQQFFPEWTNFLGTNQDSNARQFLKSVVKRSGDVEDYDSTKILTAIGKAIEAVEKRPNPDKAELLTNLVEERLRFLMAGRHENSIPAIEEIQDVVEYVLI